MNLKFMQLDKNAETGEDNEKDSWKKIKAKLEEESKELIEAIEEKDLMHISEETFDLIQVAIRCLVLLGKVKLDIVQLNRRHNRKLIKRGWTHINIIRIFWDK